MRAFSEPLYGTVQPITNADIESTVFAPNYPREIWYSIKDGNWTDPTIWSTVGHRRSDYPGSNTSLIHDVYVHSTVTASSIGAVTINNLFVNGTLSWLNQTLTVNGNVQATGTISMGAGASIIQVKGANNYINNYLCGSSSTFAYIGNLDQPIMNLIYWSLTIGNSNGGTGFKRLSAPLEVLSNLAVGSFTSSIARTCTFDLMGYSLTVDGTTSLTAGGNIYTGGTAPLLFIGLLTLNSTSAFDMVGNPTVECRGGFNTNTASFISGTGDWSFTTNSQNLTVNSGVTASFNGAIKVVGAITITNIFTTTTGIMQINQSLDNTSASGSFVNKGIVYWNNASFFNVTTGTFDKDNFSTNVVGYIFNGSVTLPYTTYQGLRIDGTGTKTSLGTTTLGTTLAITSTATLELSTFDFTISTTTALDGVLSKNGAGNVLFIGSLNYGNSVGRIDFATGNPTVELRGGIVGVNTFDVGVYNTGGLSSSSGAAGVAGWYSTSAHLKTGTGLWTFSTNNQTVSGGRFIFQCPVLISGAITVTMGGNYNNGGTNNAEVTSSASPIFNNTLDGTVAGSTLKASGWVGFNNATAPFATAGTLDTTTVSNTIAYLYDGNYTVLLTTYWNLQVGGNGVKTLAGNTTITGTLQVGAVISAGVVVLDCAAYNLAITGTTSLSFSNGGNYTLRKSGAGSITFGGQVIFGNSINTGNPSGYSLDFTGNPAVEFKGGATGVNTLNNQINSGTGTWTFSTNNQTWDTHNNAGASPVGATINANILISGAITLTITNTGAGTGNLIVNGTINGDNASSTFDNRTPSGTTAAGLNYRNAVAPMMTGVLKCNAAANRFFYDGNVSQSVQGGTTHLTTAQYWHLTLGGTATPNAKTLLGNVSVLNTYTVTGNATKVNGIYSFGNP